MGSEKQVLIPSLREEAAFDPTRTLYITPEEVRIKVVSDPAY
jgi:hypothetical protein